MIDEGFMTSVMRNGICGTHLGGEGAIKYNSSVESLRSNIEIFDFLTGTKYIKKALEDGYLRHLVSDKKALKILENVKVEMGPAPRGHILKIEREVYKEIQNMYSTQTKQLKENHSNKRFNDCLDALKKDTGRGFIYKGGTLLKSKLLKELLATYEASKTSVIELEDLAITRMKKDLRLTPKACDTYATMFILKKNIRYI